MTMTKAKNPILDELHAVRTRLLAQAGGTLDDLVDRLQAEEQQSDRPRFKPRRTSRSTKAASSGELPVDSQSSPPGDR
jgi:hypothetical protein